MHASRISIARSMSSLRMVSGGANSNACPTGGTIASTGTMDWYCSGGGLTLGVAGSWESMATYDGTQVVVVMESDGTQWNYAGPCSGL